MLFGMISEKLTDHKGHQLFGDGGGGWVHQQQPLPGRGEGEGEGESKEHEIYEGEGWIEVNKRMRKREEGRKDERGR